MDNNDKQALPSLQEEYKEKRTRRYFSTRAIMDFGMGVLYIAVGFFIMFPKLMGFELSGFDNLFRYIFGGLCVIYGGWRIYRGIKKDY